MKIVQVVIHQGVYSLVPAFDYLCPESCEPSEMIGKRVQVPWGNRHTEGIVIDGYEKDGDPALKAVQNIMDEEPVLSRTMIEMAKWMSGFYVCSLSVCLRLMIPALLTRKKNPSFQLDEMKWENFVHRMKENFSFPSGFPEELKKKPMSQKEISSWMTPEQIQRLLQEKILIPCSEYYAKDRQTNDWVYSLTAETGEEKKQEISSRAVRQQALYQWIQERGEISLSEIRKRFSLSLLHQLERKNQIRKKPRSLSLQTPDWTLTWEQQNVEKRIETHLKKESFSELLLYGVTGSGKTEVYIRSILHCLEQGKTAMFLVPEIALAQQVHAMLKNRIPHLALFHSGKSNGERYEAWKQVKDGTARVVIGARSALFAPLEKIGLLIIDEEQEASYKNEKMPCYHTVDVARHRMQMEKGVLLLGTATPTMESMRRVLEGKMEMLTLLKRVSRFPEPRIFIENLRGQKNMMTLSLKEKIQERLERKEQTILFVNRRGYSHRTVCMNCGEIQKCPHCSVAMVYHQDDGKNHCHYCNYSAEASAICSVCGEDTLHLVGMGTQKLEELCKEMFPQAVVARLDLDAASHKGYHKELLQRLNQQEVDILIGTQMLAKGLHLPHVSLVGIIDADALLGIPDFRADERAVQLFLQVSGRAGRADKEGEVVLQTFQPLNPLFQILFRQDYLSFTRKELSLRRHMAYPPYTHICRILTRSRDEEESYQAIREISEQSKEWLLDAEGRSFQLLGPAPCVIYKVQDMYRNQFLIKAADRSLIVSLVHRIIRMEKRLTTQYHVRLDIDFDPIRFS